jgi:N-carbamoylputrescine amidase
MSQSTKTVRIAAIQMASENGKIEANLNKAETLVEQAESRGAQLVILPEFMPTGYIFTTSIWDAGEPKEGPTVQWMRKLSKKLGIYLGTSFLEAEGDDFYNTFLITKPDGSEAGRVRKQTPATFESYFTRGEPSNHVIETELGRIGIGICYETQLSYITNMLCEQSIDLLLMPHSAPAPEPSFIFPQKAVDSNNENMKNLTVYYASLLGIPAVMINKWGPWESPTPGVPFLCQHSAFMGYTAIADSDGGLLSQLGYEEGILVEDVSLDPEKKTHVAPQCQGRWSQQENWHKYLFILVETMGKNWYKMSRERRRRAREISGTADLAS